MKKLFILTILIFNLLFVFQYAKAGGATGIASCIAPSSNPYGGCSAEGNGRSWETYYKSNSNLLILWFHYYLSSTPSPDEWVWGMIGWDSLDPAGPSPRYASINTNWWNLDPTPREEWINDYYSPEGAMIYIEALAYGGTTSYPDNSLMECYAAWW